jgi:hypothetical protein
MKPEFHVYLNINGLLPRAPLDWPELCGQIKADLATGSHPIDATVKEGSYARHPNEGFRPFILIASNDKPQPLDLQNPEDSEEYRAVETAVSELISKYHLT